MAAKFVSRWIILIFILLMTGLVPLKTEGIMVGTQQYSVTGIARNNESNPDGVYRAAFEDGLRKAAQQIAKADQERSMVNGSIDQLDPVEIQKKFGITDSRIKRYWIDQDQFNLELIIVADGSGNEAASLSTQKQSRLGWVFEPGDRILAVKEKDKLITVDSVQSISVIKGVNGEKVRTIKTGSKPHLVHGNNYLIRNGAYLKIFRLNRLDFFSYTDLWAVEVPQMVRYITEGNNLFVVEQSGLVRVFDWETGDLLWKSMVGSNVDILYSSEDFTLMSDQHRQIWSMTAKGEKRWHKKLDHTLKARPIVYQNLVYYFLENGVIEIISLETGGQISAWETKPNGLINQAFLKTNGKELLVLYNNQSKRSQLMAFHAKTGNILWKLNWEEPASGLNLFKDSVIIGFSNLLEGHELWLGLKVWEEKTFGPITGMYATSENLVVASDNRLYCYNLK